MLVKLRLVLTIRCEEASQLASDSLDRSLMIHERLALRMHQLVCWSCRQFEKHLKIMRAVALRAAAQQAKDLEVGSELPKEFKDRLKKLA